MSFSATPTYAELKTGIANWLRRSDMADFLDDIILMGEKWIFRHARTRDMEADFTGTISSGTLAQPSDYVELKHAYISSSGVSYNLQPKAADWIYLKYPTRSADKIPSFIAEDQGVFVFGPYPDSAYTVAGTYYKRLTAVATSANALFTKNPDLYLAASLAEAIAFIKNDARLQMWVNKRDSILMDVNGEFDRAKYSGGPLTMVPA